MKATRPLFFAILFAFSIGVPVPAAAHLPLPSFRAIRNGNEIERVSRIWRHTVMLEAQDSLCTGTILNDQYVLTAAHCLKYSIDTVVFYTGSRQEFARRPVKAAFIHPLYNQGRNGFDFDIGLVRFEGGLPSNHFYAPTLLKTEAPLLSGKKMQLAGFGMTRGDQAAGTTSGLFSTRQELGQTEKGTYLFFNTFDRNGVQGVCPGDSGGPAFLEEGNDLLLAGVITRKLGGKGCVDSPVSIAIALPFFLPWIGEVTGLDLL